MSTAVVVPLPADRAARPAAGLSRLTAIDALRGIAIAAMALDHAAASAHVSLQAESYGGAPAILGSLPSVGLGLLTNMAAPTFWFLAGVSLWLFAASKRAQGQSDWEIVRFSFVRATVLAVLDLTIVWLAWSGTTPYTHVLLSLAVSLALLGLARLLPFALLAASTAIWMGAYQWGLPSLATRLGDGARAGYGEALAYYFSYATVPATEFSILGWGSLMFLGYVLGRYARSPRFRRGQTWLGVGAVLLATWAVLRLIGHFGDLSPYSSELPVHYIFIMNKTPPALTFLLFNLGIAAILYALLQMNESWLPRLPLRWAVWMGQVSLFAFVAHLVIYGVIGRLVLLVPLPLPGVVRAVIVWLIGLAVLIPLVGSYRALRRARPDSVLRYA